MIHRLHTEMMAMISVGGFAGTTALAWLEVANAYLQFIAFIVSIAAGLAALHSWWKRSRDEVKKDG